MTEMDDNTIGSLEVAVDSFIAVANGEEENNLRISARWKKIEKLLLEYFSENDSPMIDKRVGSCYAKLLCLSKEYERFPKSVRRWFLYEEDWQSGMRTNLTRYMQDFSLRDTLLASFLYCSGYGSINTTLAYPDEDWMPIERVLTKYFKEIRSEQLVNKAIIILTNDIADILVSPAINEKNVERSEWLRTHLFMLNATYEDAENMCEKIRRIEDYSI